MTHEGTQGGSGQPPAMGFGEWSAAAPSPWTIRAASFGMVRRGFNPGEVRGFLERVAGEVEVLRDRIRRLEDGSAAASSTGTSEGVRRLDEQADEIMREARFRREQAGADAAATVAAAQADADRMLLEAGSKADALVREVESRRRTALRDLSRMRDLLREALGRLDDALETSGEADDPTDDIIVVDDAPDDAHTAR